VNSFIGSAAVGQIEIDGDQIVAAAPRIAVHAMLVRAAVAQPGGFLGVESGDCEVGAVVRFSFGLDRLVYRITELRDGYVIMEWPD
jgi:hypothetical protein